MVQEAEYPATRRSTKDIQSWLMMEKMNAIILTILLEVDVQAKKKEEDADAGTQVTI